MNTLSLKPVFPRSSNPIKYSKWERGFIHVLKVVLIIFLLLLYVKDMSRDCLPDYEHISIFFVGLIIVLAASKIWLKTVGILFIGFGFMSWGEKVMEQKLYRIVLREPVRVSEEAPAIISPHDSAPELPQPPSGRCILQKLTENGQLFGFEDEDLTLVAGSYDVTVVEVDDDGNAQGEPKTFTMFLSQPRGDLPKEGSIVVIETEPDGTTKIAPANPDEEVE